MYFKNFYREKKLYVVIGVIGWVIGYIFILIILGDGCG